MVYPREKNYVSADACAGILDLKTMLFDSPFKINRPLHGQDICWRHLAGGGDMLPQ